MAPLTILVPRLTSAGVSNFVFRVSEEEEKKQ
jgi:hypothetical protein